MFQKTVVDTLGVKWHVTFNFLRAGLIKDAIGFDIFDQGEKDDDGKVIRPSVGERFERGEFSPYDVAWFICSPQAKMRGITREQFLLERFEDQEIFQACADALESFFQSAAKKKKEAQSGAAQASGGIGAQSGDSPPALKSQMSHAIRLENSLNEPGL